MPRFTSAHQQPYTLCVCEFVSVCLDVPHAIDFCSAASLFNLYSTLGYMCINGGNTLGSLNATAFADFMRLFFARKV